MTTYKDAGVDIDAGDALVERIKPLAARTLRPEVLVRRRRLRRAVRASRPAYNEPVLVSGTDGVGTKLKLAFAAGRHDTVGIDLVAMCVNDVLTCGAEPLFFLDYFATAKLDVDRGRAGDRRHRRGLRAGRAARSSAARRPSCPASTRRASTTWPASASASSRSAQHHRRHAHPPRATRSSACALERPALERLLAGAQGAVGRRAVAAHAEGSAARRALLAPTRIYVKAVLALLRRGEGEGPRAHHRRRPARQPAALPARRARRGAATSAAWPRPPIFDRLAQLGQRRRATRCSAPSTWASAWSRWCRRPTSRAALALLEGRGVEAWEVGAHRARARRGAGRTRRRVEP